MEIPRDLRYHRYQSPLLRFTTSFAIPSQMRRMTASCEKWEILMFQLGEHDKVKSNVKRRIHVACAFIPYLP